MRKRQTPQAWPHPSPDQHRQLERLRTQTTLSLRPYMISSIRSRRHPRRQGRVVHHRSPIATRHLNPPRNRQLPAAEKAVPKGRMGRKSRSGCSARNCKGSGRLANRLDLTAYSDRQLGRNHGSSCRWTISVCRTPLPSNCLYQLRTILRERNYLHVKAQLLQLSSVRVEGENVNLEKSIRLESRVQTLHLVY